MKVWPALIAFVLGAGLTAGVGWRWLEGERADHQAWQDSTSAAYARDTSALAAASRAAANETLLAEAIRDSAIARAERRRRESEIHLANVKYLRRELDSATTAADSLSRFAGLVTAQQDAITVLTAQTTDLRSALAAEQRISASLRLVLAADSATTRRHLARITELEGRLPTPAPPTIDKLFGKIPDWVKIAAGAVGGAGLVMAIR